MSGFSGPFRVTPATCPVENQIEGLNLVRYCDPATGNTTGYAGVTLDETTNAPMTVYFDASLQQSATAPTGEPCNSEIDSAKCTVRCMCDDVNGDGTNIVQYVEAYVQTANPNTNVITSALAGTFTDESLTTAYTPTNPVDCNSIGSPGLLRTIEICDDNGTFYRDVDIISGAVIHQYDANGAPYTPVGTIRDCSQPQVELVQECRCDDVDGNPANTVTYIEIFKRECQVDGTITSTSVGTYTDSTLATAYTPINPVDCDSVADDGVPHIICAKDSTGTRFYRWLDVISGTILRNFDAAGNDYTPTGAIEPCSEEQTEIVTICHCDDVNGDGSSIVEYTEAFKRTCDSSGAVSSSSLGLFTDETLTTAYAPVNPMNCNDVGTNAVPQVIKVQDSTGDCFFRWVDVISGTVLRNFDASGQDYAPVGVVTPCICEQTTTGTGGGDVTVNVEQRQMVEDFQCISFDIDAIGAGAQTIYTLSDIKAAAIAAGATQFGDGTAITTSTTAHALDIVMFSGAGSFVNGQFTSSSFAQVNNTGGAQRNLSGSNSATTYSANVGADISGFQNVEFQPGSAAAFSLCFGKREVITL